MVPAAWWMEQKKLLRWVEPLATFAVALAAVLLLRRLVGVGYARPGC